MLNADRIGKPKAAALDGAGKGKARIPVTEMDAFLNVDAGGGIGGAETPAVIAFGSFQAEDVGAGMRRGGADVTGLDFRGASGVHVETSGELAIDGVADFEAVEEVLGFSGTGAGDVQIGEIIASDFRQSGEALREDVRAGDGNITNVVSSESISLSGVLWIDLIGGSGDLDTLVKFFGVVQGEREIVRAGLKREGAAGNDEEAFLADFKFVIASGKISESEAAGAVGFGSVDAAGGVFEFDLCGGDGHVVFIEEDGRASCQVRRAR